MSNTTWNVDASHSNVQFKVKHLRFFDVTGNFTSFDGTLTTAGDGLEGGSIVATVDVASIRTDNDQRDEHLKSDDFFNAEAFPQLKFESTGITKSGDDYEITGNLTIRDITKPVSLKAQHAGKITDMYGQTKTGIAATTTINRQEFGLKWNGIVEGVNVVSDNVELILNVQFSKAE